MEKRMNGSLPQRATLRAWEWLGFEVVDKKDSKKLRMHSPTLMYDVVLSQTDIDDYILLNAHNSSADASQKMVAETAKFLSRLAEELPVEIANTCSNDLQKLYAYEQYIMQKGATRLDELLNFLAPVEHIAATIAEVAEVTVTIEDLVHQAYYVKRIVGALPEKEYDQLYIKVFTKSIRMLLIQSINDNNLPMLRIAMPLHEDWWRKREFIDEIVHKVERAGLDACKPLLIMAGVKVPDIEAGAPNTPKAESSKHSSKHVVDDEEDTDAYDDYIKSVSN